MALFMRKWDSVSVQFKMAQSFRLTVRMTSDPIEFITLTQTFFNKFLSQISTATELCLANHFKSYVSLVFMKMEKVSDRETG